MRASAYIQMERERDAGLIPVGQTVRLDLTPAQLCTVCQCVAGAAAALVERARLETNPFQKSLTMAGMADLIDLLKHLRGE